MGAPQSYVSISRRPPDVEDYIDMIRRYRSWIIGPMFLGLVVSTCVAFYWDDTYTSRATMRLTPQQVSERLVQNTASTQLSERLEQISTNILSHTNLISIITDPALNLYPKDRASGKALEDIATDMYKDIKTGLIGSPMELDNHRVASAFYIQFSYNDRFKAQKVVNKLVSMYEDQNSREQRAQAKTTSSFLNDQLKQSQEKLAAAEAAITRFTMENKGRLPLETQSLLSQQQNLRVQLATANEQIQTQTLSKTYLETQLKTLQNQQKSVTQELETTIPGAATVANERVTYWQKNLSDAKTQLDAVQKNYKDTMPDVQRLKDAVAFAQSQLEQALKEDTERVTQTPSGPVRVRNAQAADRLESLKAEESQVKAQIANGEVSIQNKMKMIDEINHELRALQTNIDASGLNSNEYQRLIRERDVAQAEVQDASKKQLASATQESLEERQAGERLDTLDMATLPQTATEPKREVWTAVGTVLGLLLGLLLAGAKEMKDTSLKNLKDVRAYTNLPVLTSIPLLENALLVRRKRRLFWLAWTSAFILGVICISLSMYYHFVLRA